ncbi:hypothetical protein [Ralstonia insidiosa]|uniref:hypothetical protein n=1 Tax=Ralstonia insidiosa TaxID=190721 RepID=UPI000CEE2007|nr:hypothetical protein [Ralstonia insidiosa]
MMAANNATPFPPPNLQIANPDGTLERNWYELFLKLFVRTGGTQPSSNVDDLLNLVYEMQAQAEAQSSSAQAAFLVDALRAMADAVEQRSQGPELSAIIARIDDLERRLQESVDLNSILSRLDATESASSQGIDVSRYIERFIAGPVSATSGTATTVHTLQNGAPAAWLVHASFNFMAADAVNYSAFAVILTDTNSARIALSSNAPNMSISLSGLNVQVTQSSGAPQPVTLSISKVG